MSRTCFYQWFDFYKTTTKIKQTKKFFSFYDWATRGADESGASSVIIKIWRSVSALVSVDFTTHSKESDWVWHFMSARQNHSTNAKTSFNLANGVLKWRWNDRSSQDINQFITIHIYRILFIFFLKPTHWTSGSSVTAPRPLSPGFTQKHRRELTLQMNCGGYCSSVVLKVGGGSF